jgi:predicted NUDIX family NTP pyrophosphohydrolase
MKRSAGILLFRQNRGETEVLLAHPGGPFWRHKDEGAWSIPKGEYKETENPLDAAVREFTEEIGTAPSGPFIPLGEIRQAGGKHVTAWAAPGDLDPAALRSNTFTLNGVEFPEIDRVEWFTLDRARSKILERQRTFLDRLRDYQVSSSR